MNTDKKLHRHVRRTGSDRRKGNGSGRNKPRLSVAYLVGRREYEEVITKGGDVEGQLHDLLEGIEAVRRGDLTKRLRKNRYDILGEIADSYNGLMESLGSFTTEVTRVARKVGADGKLGGQAQVAGVAGTLKELTDNMNAMASNLTNQARNIAQVSMAVADGTHAPLLLSGPQIKDDQQKLLGGGVVEKDITEIKKLKLMQEQLISTTSHALRTPITIIQCVIINLIDGLSGNLNKMQMNLIQIAARNIKSMNRIVNNLLDISRLESDQLQLSLGKIQPTEILREVINNHEVIVQKKKLFLRENIEPNLPDIVADADLITQVLNNLMSNALRYAKTGITVAASIMATGVLFSVSNDGAYLSSEDIGKLFCKFSQINRPHGGTGYKGTGLGLVICKNIIDKHGGRIWIESEKDGLTCCQFVIPVPPL